MKRIITLIALGLFGLAEVGAKPNVLFIAIDDLNDWIGVLGGHPQARTPNLDRLAKRATLFTRTYCQAPACNPSRASLMTGILPSTSGVYLNSQPWRVAMPDAVTLPQHFMKHGYWAGGAGKIYHGRFPDPASWNSYWPSPTKNKPNDPLPTERPINGIPKTAHFDWGPLDVPDEKMGDHQVADWVIGQLGLKREKPFFLACGIYKPHLPWYIPRKYYDLFDAEKLTLPNVPEDDLGDIPAAGVKMAQPQGDHARVLKHDQWRKAVHGYLAAGAFADEQVGRVLASLETSGQADNTIIVLWTDHGWHLGEKKHWRKFTLWEESARTPLMFVVPKGLAKTLPGGTHAGVQLGHPVGLIDIYPTLLELCGLPANEANEGRSLVPLLTDKKTKWQRPALTTHGRNNHGLRTPRWRYIRYADGSEELYDHETDPGEWRNLADNPKLVDTKKRLARWLPKTNAPNAEYRRR